MNLGIYRAASSMTTHKKDLDVVAANLANVSTTGFKRSTSSIREFRISGQARDVRGLGTKHSVDFSQGELNRTGRQLDMALDGEGFFSLEGPDGEIYTRDGQFHMDQGGVLVNGEGMPVAWERLFAPIDPTGLPISVDPEGGVRQGQRDLGTLRIVNFEDPQRLRRLGPGTWAAPDGLQETTHTAAVHQFALEGSNTTAIEEMISMIAIQRSFESSARLLDTIKESYQRLTRPM